MRTVLASMAFLGVAACDAPAPAPPSPIALKTPLAVTDGQAGVTYGQVTSSAAVIDTARAPAPFETLVADTTCRQPRYRSGAKVAYVHLYGGQIRAPLQF